MAQRNSDPNKPAVTVNHGAGTVVVRGNNEPAKALTPPSR